MAVLNFFQVQKWIFGHFWNCKKNEIWPKIFSWNWFIWFHEFFWPGLFKIFWPAVTAVYFKQVCYTGVCFYPPKQTLIWFPLCYKPLPKLDRYDHQMYEYIVWFIHPKFWQNDQLIQRQNADCLGQMPRIIPNFCVQRVLKPMYHEFCKKIKI